MLLDASCRLSLTGSDLVGSARRAASGISGTSVVAVVSGDRADQPALRLAGSVFGTDARRIVVRADPGSGSRLDDIGGLRSASVSELGHLPALLAWQVG